MRTLTVLIAIALTLSPLGATAAHAGGPGHGDDDENGSGGGGGGGQNGEARIEGAGQRLHFSFGGRIRVKQNKAKGKFSIVAHPLAPQGTTVVVACRYNKFSEVVISAASATFRAEGKCQRLLTSGVLENFDVVNNIQIVNGTPNDSIDANFVGATGISIPGGAMDFGGFTLTPQPS